MFKELFKNNKAYIQVYNTTETYGIKWSFPWYHWTMRSQIIIIFRGPTNGTKEKDPLAQEEVKLNQFVINILKLYPQNYL